MRFKIKKISVPCIYWIRPVDGFALYPPPLTPWSGDQFQLNYKIIAVEIKKKKFKFQLCRLILIDNLL